MGEVQQTTDRGSLRVVNVPEVFSVISNPEGVIRVLAALAAIGKDAANVGSIFFDHSRMREYDLAAEQALDSVATEIERGYELSRRQLRTLGRYPEGESAVRFLKAIGIIRSLNVTHERIPSAVQQKLEIFVAHRAQGKEEVVFGSADRKSRETRRFVDHIDRCLARRHRKLTDSGIERLATYAGEVLANAEEHSGRGEWLLAGYLDDATSDHICEIAVLSFGQSFSETFLRLETMSFPRSQVEPYLEAHSEGGFFSPAWTVEDLLTVVALQGGISCKNQSDADTRGKGTIDLIRFFEQMHEECARGGATPCEMAILSGGLIYGLTEVIN